MGKEKGLLDGIKRKQSTLIFESDVIKKTFKTEVGKDGKKHVPQDVAKSHTLVVEFDLSDLTTDEIITALVSTTSFMKQFQNNILKYWDEGKILEECKNVYKLSIRQMLDDRAKQNALSTDARIEREIRRGIAKGESPSDVIVKIESMINDLKTQL